MAHPPLQCPSCCAGLVFTTGAGLACETCSAPLHEVDLVLDVELEPCEERPAPLERGDLAGALDLLRAGEAYKPVLERLLLDLPEERAEKLMGVLREGRGAFGVLLRSSVGAALVAGNALSGTVVALARAGFRVTVVDGSRERLAFGAHRNLALAGADATRSVRVAAGDRMPFADDAFELVVREAPFEDESPPSLEECRRLAREELVVTADNRLGYKQSSGKRGDFRVVSPLAFARNALVGDRKTLGGWRRALKPGIDESTRAYALYPHSRDFTHVAALDERGPRLYVGPKERANPVKIAAYRAGLFSVLTPSFAVVLARGERVRAERRLEHVLAELARTLDEPVPTADALLSTRGNNALAMTSLPGDGEAGHWIVRVPLNPIQARLVEREHTMLSRVRAGFPTVPVPEPLFLGEIDGLFLSCERRLRGHSAAQFSGSVEAMERLYREAAGHLSELVVERAVLDEPLFERLVGARHELVRAHAEPESTRRSLAAMHELARERLLGRELPLVLRHSDLRSKHVQIDARGAVLGYYDWGTAEEPDLPLYDLLHLVVHERKQESGLAAGEAWRRVCGSGAGLRPGERAALDDYCRRVGLEPDARRAIEEIYPLLVGAMAERNWDYSRPRWLHRGFGI